VATLAKIGKGFDSIKFPWWSKYLFFFAIIPGYGALYLGMLFGLGLVSYLGSLVIVASFAGIFTAACWINRRNRFFWLTIGATVLAAFIASNALLLLS
jgi:hypothetical protein